MTSKPEVLSFNLLSDTPHVLIPMRSENGEQFVWYSICSKHQSHNSDCDLCNVGSWHKMKLEIEDD